MQLLIIFIVLNVLNVVIQTVKSIATIKCGKIAAALINATAYGLYTVVLVYMNCDLELWQKVAVVGGANLVGVFVVKLFEEKGEKEKYWKIEATVTKEMFETYKEILLGIPTPHNYIDIEKYVIINLYCKGKKQRDAAKVFLTDMNAKYIETETKTLVP